MTYTLKFKARGIDRVVTGESLTGIIQYAKTLIEIDSGAPLSVEHNEFGQVMNSQMIFDECMKLIELGK